jgi:hypothetical protein
MKEKVEHAKPQAAQARENALGTGDPRAKEEWCRMARMWEEVAHEFGEVQKLRDQYREGAG